MRSCIWSKESWLKARIILWQLEKLQGKRLLSRSRRCIGGPARDLCFPNQSSNSNWFCGEEKLQFDTWSVTWQNESGSQAGNDTSRGSDINQLMEMPFCKWEAMLLVPLMCPSNLITHWEGLNQGNITQDSARWERKDREMTTSQLFWVLSKYNFKFGPTVSPYTVNYNPTWCTNRLEHTLVTNS